MKNLKHKIMCKLTKWKETTGILYDKSIPIMFILQRIDEAYNQNIGH